MESWRRGRAFEDLVEEWVASRGYPYKRNARVRGASGASHEVDFLVHTLKGYIVVEAKNYSSPLDKEAVIKAYQVAKDIGAVGAVVVSASGFTESAESMGRALGVDLLTLDDIRNQLEIARMGLDVAYLRPVDRSKARRIASKCVARSLFILPIPLLPRERVSGLECVYAPFYYIRARASLGGGRFRDVDIVASALTGLPIAVHKGGVRDSLGPLASLPEDVLEDYKRYAGRTISRQDYVALRGESSWRRFKRALSEAGLLRVVRDKPLTVKVVDSIPRIDELEKASEFFVAKASRSPEKGCKILEPIYSPGSVSSLLSRVLEMSVSSVALLYAPIFKVRLEDDKGSYRFCYLAGWLEEKLEYVPERSIN